MAEVDDRNIIFLLDLFDRADHVRHLAARHDDVLVVLGGIDVPQRRGHQTPHTPKLFRLGGVLGGTELHQPQRRYQFVNPGRLLLDQVAVAVHLDQQHRPALGRNPQAEAPLDALQRGIVHEFQRGRNNLVADNR